MVYPGCRGAMVDPGGAHHTKVNECIYGVSLGQARAVPVPEPVPEAVP